MKKIIKKLEESNIKVSEYKEDKKLEDFTPNEYSENFKLSYN